MAGEVRLPTAGDKDYGYELAYRIAREQLSQVKDKEDLCLKSGARFNSLQQTISLDFLNHSYTVTFPQIDVLTSSGEAMPLREKILILHYLLNARGTHLSHDMITFKELAEGAGYFPSFYQRTIKPLISCFGNEPARMLIAAQALGGEKASHGDVSVTIPALPKVSITIVLWRSDDDFPPEGTILFDRTISNYLSTEDITVLCQLVSGRLMKLSAGNAGS